MFENSRRQAEDDNVHIVSYRRIEHAKLRYGIHNVYYFVFNYAGVDAFAIRAVAPLQSLRSLFYWNLEKFAHAIVSVPKGTDSAVVTKQVNLLYVFNRINDIPGESVATIPLAKCCQYTCIYCYQCCADGNASGSSISCVTCDVIIIVLIMFHRTNSTRSITLV